VVTPLQKHTGVPVYRQLQGLVRENIASGVWKVGQAIPSEQALVQRYGIARMTVRQALDGLIREGLLRRERGRGTFVAQQWVERELSRLRSFSEDMRARNMVPSARLVSREVIPAPPHVSEYLKLGVREAVIYLKRLRLADASPMALECAYFVYALFQPILEADLVNNSLYELIQNTFGLRLTHASQEFAVVTPSAGDAQLLGLSKRDATLMISQTTYVEVEGRDVPAIHGHTLYRGDSYRFRMVVPR
jgi:GntR family transcriptional regulator